MDDFRPNSGELRDEVGHSLPLPPPEGRVSGELDPFMMYGSAMPEAGWIRRIVRQWWLVAAVTAVAMLGGMVYLNAVLPTYTSTSLLLIEPTAVRGLGADDAPPATSVTPKSDHFLNTQCQVIASTPVLALAIPQIGSIDTLSGVARPIPFLKSRLAVTTSTTDDLVHVSASANNPADANRIVSAVVDAYRAYQSTQWQNSAKQVLSILDTGREAHAKEMAAKAKQLQDLARTAPEAADPAALGEQVRSLNDAYVKAHLELINAHNAYDGASRAVVGDQAKLDAVADLEQRTGSVADPAAELAKVQAELTDQQAKLTEAGRQYMPGHPIMRAIQQRIDQLTVAAVAAAEQWWDDAQAREVELKQQLADARQQDIAQQTHAAEYARVAADVDRLKKMDDVLDSRMKDIDLARGAGAMNISVLQYAEIAGPPKPQPLQTLGIAAASGVLAGLLMAIVRDGRDDRLRSPTAVQASLHLPVVASVPAIAGARTAADRSQIVHHDPFGPAAESYRTLQTALQYGLPAGTKTILVTSPTSGDGKSTLISNLAIALAQAGRRVLVVDADFRAPMQHRLFTVKDRAGLTTLLGGNVEVEQALQRTEIERVSLLPCGPVPTNPAEVLNNPAFSEILTDLADRFDFILVDSPPVTAVADARILATLCDVSLLVLRAHHSTRRLAVQSRDALRSVGAKIVGVAINGVSAGGEFATTPGYAARPAAAPAAPVASAHPSPRALALAATALKTGPRKRHRA